LCFGADIDGGEGAAMTSLTSDTVAVLADEIILTSKFCTSGGVRGKENDAREVEAEWEHDGVSGAVGVE